MGEEDKESSGQRRHEPELVKALARRQSLKDLGGRGAILREPAELKQVFDNFATARLRFWLSGENRAAIA